MRCQFVAESRILVLFFQLHAWLACDINYLILSHWNVLAVSLEHHSAAKITQFATWSWNLQRIHTHYIVSFYILHEISASFRGGFEYYFLFPKISRNISTLGKSLCAASNPMAFAATSRGNIFMPVQWNHFPPAAHRGRNIHPYM